MRVFVLGGAGLMGSEVSRDLLNEPDIREVVIADLDVGRARRLARDLQDPRITVVEADARNTRATADQARGYDLLFNCTFFDNFSDALTAACEARVTYADLLSTPQPYHFEQVDAAGILAISGLGATPGMTNILGRLGCEWFDVPTSVEISWASFRPLAYSAGLLGGMFWEMGPECATRQFFRNGEFIRAGSFEGSKQVDFANPIGRQTVYFMAHTETVALPKMFPNLHFVCVRGTWRPPQMRILRTLGDLGLMDFVEQETLKGSVNVAQFTMNRILAVKGGAADPESWGFFLNVEVAGLKDDRHGLIRFKIFHPDDWREKATPKMTGIPAAVQAAIMMRQGPTKAGLLDATEYFDRPHDVLRALRARGTVQVELETEPNGLRVEAG